MARARYSESSTAISSATSPTRRRTWRTAALAALVSGMGLATRTTLPSSPATQRNIHERPAGSARTSEARPSRRMRASSSAPMRRRLASVRASSASSEP
ncbi:MAG: hypothetical protein M5U28_42795 [Sandaracinaceae bacterium]|nr:hypothetical protein [Sandaracinaceae bacterium]